MNMTERVKEVVHEWLSECESDFLVSHLYLFGSSVYEEGRQFVQDSSDVDLIVTIPEIVVAAVERKGWIECLKRHKSSLEKLLITEFSRSRNDSQVVSIVPLC